MTCGDCHYYEPSDTQGRGLPGYGYCRLADTPELRARFFPASSACWLNDAKRQSPEPTR